jgi:hypothetical protein
LLFLYYFLSLFWIFCRWCTCSMYIAPWPIIPSGELLQIDKVLV